MESSDDLHSLNGDSKARALPEGRVSQSEDAHLPGSAKHPGGTGLLSD